MRPYLRNELGFEVALQIAQHVTRVGVNYQAVFGQGDDSTPQKALSVTEMMQAVDGALGVFPRAYQVQAQPSAPRLN